MNNSFVQMSTSRDVDLSREGFLHIHELQDTIIWNCLRGLHHKGAPPAPSSVDKQILASVLWSGLVRTGHHRMDSKERGQNESDSNLLTALSIYIFIICQNIRIKCTVLNDNLATQGQTRTDFLGISENIFLQFVLLKKKNMLSRWKTGLLKDHCCAFLRIYSRSALKQRLIMGQPLSGMMLV